MPRGDSSSEKIRSCALALFSRHGVAGTSLQMIATELGVTKAAIYHHFRAKEDIVRAVLAPAFDGFQAVLDAAARTEPPKRADLVITGLARQAVAHRELYAVVLQDVTAGQLRRESPAHLNTFEQLRDTLAGPAADDDARVRASIFLSGLMGPAVDPDIRLLDDATLERAITQAGRGLLGLAP